jgi:hypothetical protein
MTRVKRNLKRTFSKTNRITEISKLKTKLQDLTRLFNAKSSKILLIDKQRNDLLKLMYDEDSVQPGVSIKFMENQIIETNPYENKVTVKKELKQVEDLYTYYTTKLDNMHKQDEKNITKIEKLALDINFFEKKNKTLNEINE